MNAWVIARPQRLLGWWTGLAVMCLLGVAAVIAAPWVNGFLLSVGAVLLAVAVPNLAADVRYMRRAWSAWRQAGDSTR